MSYLLASNLPPKNRQAYPALQLCKSAVKKGLAAAADGFHQHGQQVRIQLVSLGPVQFEPKLQK